MKNFLKAVSLTISFNQVAVADESFYNIPNEWVFNPLTLEKYSYSNKKENNHHLFTNILITVVVTDEEGKEVKANQFRYFSNCELEKDLLMRKSFSKKEDKKLIKIDCEEF